MIEGDTCYLQVLELEDVNEEIEGRQISKKKPGRVAMCGSTEAAKKVASTVTATKQKNIGTAGLARVPTPSAAAASVQERGNSDDEDYDYDESSDSDFKGAIKGGSKAPSMWADSTNKYVGTVASFYEVQRKRKYAVAAASKDAVYRKRIYGGAVASTDGKQKAGVDRGQKVVNKSLRARGLCRLEEKLGAAVRASSPDYKPSTKDLARSTSPVHKPPTQKGPAQKVRRVQVSHFNRNSGPMLRLKNEEKAPSITVVIRPKRAIRAVKYAESEDKEDNYDSPSSDF
ncbi:hypothetical protein L7F22_056158 [Adiantum nelumboides]|nr:hypothetical protein [Adiantum nelumboides]MCO5602031.1 hypothetical protein [Adiantum nelumboides]